MKCLPVGGFRVAGLGQGSSWDHHDDHARRSFSVDGVALEKGVLSKLVHERHQMGKG